MLQVSSHRAACTRSARPAPSTGLGTRHIAAGRRATSTIVAKAGANAVAPGDTILVAGATGGVGQLVTAKLLDRGFKVRVVERTPGKALMLFSGRAEAVSADLRDPSSLRGLMEGVAAVCCCTGTTAFPSKRWDGNNGPQPTDWDGTRNLVDAARAEGKGLKRFLLVTSVGVERQGQLPWAILNAFGVLKYKRMSEQHLAASGLPFTILRPGRLTDGPYTSFDLNTLLKATSGSRQDVQLSPRDDQAGEASRIAVAEAVVQALQLPETANHYFSLCSKEGSGPGADPAKWQQLFAACNAQAGKVPVSA